MTIRFNNVLILSVFLFLCVACGKKQASNPIESQVSDETTTQIMEVTGEDRLEQEAATYNRYNVQTITPQNPMPNIRQEVDKTSKMYIFYYVWNEDVATMETLNHEAGMRAVLQEMANTPSSLNFMKLLVEEGYGIRFDVEGSNSHKNVSNSINSSEIAQMVELAQ